MGRPQLWFKHAILCLLLLAQVGSAFCAESKPRYLEITFLTTNDIHSRLLPFDIPGDPAKNLPTVKDLGGTARRATVVRRVRSEMRTPVLLFDSGDTTYRNSYIGRLYRGEADMAVMSAIGYDALVPGNHDFEYSGDRLLEIMRMAKFPWVCANLVYAETGKPLFQPYVIKEVDGVRVAIFGMITTEATANPGLYIAAPQLGLKVLPYVETAAALVPELRKRADIVVMLSHMGTTPDVQVAHEVPGIDIVLGGHWHQLLKTPRMVPTALATAFSLGAVPVVQAGAYGECMGRTKLIFRRDALTGKYTLMSCKGEMIHIDNSIPDDPEIVGVLDELRRSLPPATPSK